MGDGKAGKSAESMAQGASEFRGRIAVHSITWRDAYIRGFEEAAQLGYRAIEPWPSFALKYEGRGGELKELLAGYGLQLTALYGGASGQKGRRFSDPACREDIVTYNGRLAAIIAACGGQHIVFGPGGPRTRPTTLAELKAAAVTITEAAKRTMEHGVKACLHPHLRTEVQEQIELDLLMELCDPQLVYFGLDTAHVTKAGMDATELIRRYGSRIAYVHLKDLMPPDAKVDDFPMLIGNEALPGFCELGLGTIDFAAIMEALREIGYDGWVTVEIDRSTSTPYRSLEICRDYVEQVLGIQVSRTDSLEG